MQDETPTGQRPQSAVSGGRNRHVKPTGLLTRLNWGSAGAVLPGFCTQIIDNFALELDLDPILYSTERMVKRSPVPIAEVIAPYGWRHLCVFIDNRGFIRKKSAFGRKGLRTACVVGKVPYWDKMTSLEMRAVLIRWAIEEEVPELM